LASLRELIFTGYDIMDDQKSTRDYQIKSKMTQINGHRSIQAIAISISLLNYVKEEEKEKKRA
jgi:hypothetical protein